VSPTTGPGGAGSGPVTGGASTGEEARAKIDRRFEETFGVFDERMRKEQEQMSQQRANRSSSAGEGSGGLEDDGEGDGAGDEGSGQGGGDEAGGTGGTGGTGEGGEGGDEGGSGESGESTGSRAGGSQGGVGGGSGGAGPRTVPEDIPDGSDDDIVARQLREAAMKETDPELRERLWDEYRRYKKGN
jgi:hypothetical protein